MANLSTAKFNQALAHAVRSVWAYNLEQEFALIRQYAQWCPFATFDTEFPGVLYEAPTHPRHMSPHQRYDLIKKNVDSLKIIQIGLTLSTRDSSVGAFITWEFNFRGFDPLRDPHASSSIKLLESHGMNFWHNFYHGVDPKRFAYLMLSSGLLLNPTRTWIGFHLAYDIGYLVKVLTGANLPDSMEKFLNVVGWYFGPRIFDLKYLCKSEGLKGSLEKIALVLNVQRVGGMSHNAGSDSLLTWHTYKRMRATVLMDGIETTKAGVLFGIQDT